MISNSLRLTLCHGAGSLALAAFLFGCASQPQQPSTSAPQVSSASTTNAAPAPPAAVPEQTSNAAAANRLKEFAAKPSAPFEGTGWESIFDGQSLAGWKETAFAGRGEVQVESGLLVLNMGDPFTGVNYTNEAPKMNYEVALDAMRVMGSDFFCGLTLPVGESHCSLIVGGWGGGLVGISSLDGMDASENETTKFVSFEQGRWYRIRLRVTPGRIEGWIDNEKLINVLLEDRRISVRPGDIELSKPFGLAAWQTTAALRQIKIRTVTGPDGPPRKF
jgi:hypothetical protein